MAQFLADMAQIDRDHGRFKRIVRGQLRKNLKKFITRGGMTGKKGKDLVSIPIHGVDLPRFRFGKEGYSGVGQGDGEVGQAIGADDDDNGNGQVGDQPGDHVREVELTLDEFAEILGEELELPDIEKKGKGNVLTEHHKYTGIALHGPEGLKHGRRTWKNALKRTAASGNYDPRNPLIVPERPDKRYKSFKTIFIPETNVVAIYIMDVSGSMGEVQKEVVRNVSNWIDIWLKYQYRGLKTRYIIHDAVAREVDRDTFFTTRESGGTIISSAYREVYKMVTRDFNPDDWNIYIFQFSDGDNWGDMDNEECNDILRKLLPKINLFGYGQVYSAWGSGEFMDNLHGAFEATPDNLVTFQMNSKDDIYDCIRQFFKKGK